MIGWFSDAEFNLLRFIYNRLFEKRRVKDLWVKNVKIGLERRRFWRPAEFFHGETVMRGLVIGLILGMLFAPFSGGSPVAMAAQSAKKPAAKKQKPKPLPETGKPVPGLEPFDRMMRAFLKKQGIPGASLAVVKDGRLVYARGFGYADVERKQPVQPDSLFRIASISKPITAVAILRLVERKKLSLDDKVLDIVKLKPHFNGEVNFDPRWKTVTIRQLLQHTGGWDRDASFDPMFRAVQFAKELKRKPPAASKDVICCMLGRPLDFDPGTKYAYSNFGYNLLGRVIEAKTGKTYEQFVKQDVLQPIGVTRMRIGGSLLEQRVAGEVRYYNHGDEQTSSVFFPDKRVLWPYGGWHHEAMDSHGAWIASAGDLARFAAAIDRPRKSKILSPGSIREMFAPPPAPVSRTKDGKLKPTYYGLGWSVRTADPGKINTWHTGSLPGTSTILVRRHDGLSWVVLMNRRKTPESNHAARLIDPLVHKAANAVKSWPKGDLFQ
jgi:N-acyl-D-amino-acid deacylase